MAIYSINNFGCGRSLKWEVKAIDIAREVKEDCVHLDVFTIRVAIIREEYDGNYLARCKVECPTCCAPYLKTSIKLSQEFNKFYGK